MYVINDYQLTTVDSKLYLSNDGKGAKISPGKLADILTALQNQPKLEISREELIALAEKYAVDIEKLELLLINQLNVLKPMLSRKFPLIYLNSDDAFIITLLQNTLDKEYNVSVVATDFVDFQSHSLVIYYRKNYSNPDFENVYQHLANDVYLVTAGVIHNLLMIDNLYYKGSGLPTHFSNLHQLMSYIHSDIPTTKNNWLLYYRDMIKNTENHFPDAKINACQQGYIAYCLYQFVSQFTNLWKAPTPLDQVNWFWHVDLTNFNVHTEVAIHSPFSEHDMKLNVRMMSA